MSDRKQFDDFFKQSFSDYSPDVPPHIWENIAAGKKKKKAAFFWLTGKKTLLTIAAVLVAGVGGLILFNQKNQSQIIAHENNGSRQEAGKTVPAAVLEDKAGTGISSADNNTKDKPVNSTAVLPGVAGNGQTAISTSPVKKMPENSATGKTVNSGNDNYDLSYTNRADIAANRKPGKLKAGKGKNAGLKVAADHIVAGGDDNGDDDDITRAVDNDASVPNIEGGREKIMLVKESIFGKPTIQPTPTKLFEDCPGSTSGNNYYIEAYISPDYAIKKYSDTANSSLVQKRKESLHFQSAFSAGLRYTRVFSNGMSIRAGFNFSQINEKFSYAQDNVVQIVYIINTAGDTTDSYYVRGTRYRNSYNHYRTIDVPVVIGYEMGNGNFHANINAGVMINLYSWQQGETLDNNGTPVSITTGKDDNPYQYKTNVGVGFTSAVSLYYKFSEKFHFLAEPYLRYNFSPMSKETISIQEKFTTIGLRLGIRMDIK